MQQIDEDSQPLGFVPAGRRLPTRSPAGADPILLDRGRTLPSQGFGLAEADRAVVVFTETTQMPKLRHLKPGFRHCYAYLRLPEGWIAVESLSHRLDIRQLPGWPREADLAARLRDGGHCALTSSITEPPRRLAPPLPFSCVETVKRLIGLHSWVIRTPWELFLHMRKNSLDFAPCMFHIVPC